MPDPKRILALVRKATFLSRATPGRSGSLIQLGEEAEEVMVVGDLHGNLAGFRAVLKLAALDKNPRRHLVLQELVHGPEESGYPNDGGDRSHQLVDVVATLKCQYPDRVHVILGNHELSEITGRVIGKNGRVLNRDFRKGIETCYGAESEEIYRAYQEFFRAMPLAIRTRNRILICHTIPEGNDLDNLDLEPLRTGVWSDVAMARRGTVYNLTWGRDNDPGTADRFAAMMDVDLFLNGHQPCPESGFMQPNHRQVIVDGTGATPAFCLVSALEPLTIDDLVGGTRLCPASLLG